MASANYLPLISVGPARGLDTSSASEHVAPGDGVIASNVSTNRSVGGLSTELGRTNLATLANYSNYTITGIIPYASSPTDQQYLLNLAKVGSSPNVTVYDPVTGAQTTGSLANALSFDSGVQFYNTVYTNAGQQYSSLNPLNLYAWHYPPPSPAIQNYTVNTVAGSLPAGTYYYAFTQVVSGPNGAFTQETTPYGAQPLTGPPPPTTLYPYTVTSNNSSGASLSGTFAGTNSDGSTYTTNVYRQSTNVPVWTLLTNLTTNATYVDNATDANIGANQLLLLYQDPPPVSATNLGAIFVHQERIFCFVIVQNAATLNQPQTQLWYSDYGTPWRFNQVAQQAGGQVLLVGNSATPASASYNGYGDNPVAGASLGGTALLFKSRSTHGLFGNDQSTYFVSPLFPIGCISRKSVIVALGQVYWLSEHGAYSYAGAGPQYLSAKVRNTLRSIPLSDKINSVSSFSNLTWYLSFPATNITLAYYTVTGEWHTLPYACNAAASIPSNPAVPLGPGGSFTTTLSEENEVVASRAGVNALDNWFVGENDLGAPATGVWQSPLTSSGAPLMQKTYDFITVLAPFQPGTCTVLLEIDPGSASPKTFTKVFTLPNTATQAETRRIVRVPPDFKGYQARVTVTFTNTTGQTTPISIYRVDVWGTMDRALVLPT